MAEVISTGVSHMCDNSTLSVNLNTFKQYVYTKKEGNNNCLIILIGIAKIYIIYLGASTNIILLLLVQLR